MSKQCKDFNSAFTSHKRKTSSDLVQACAFVSSKCKLQYSAQLLLLYNAECVGSKKGQMRGKKPCAKSNQSQCLKERDPTFLTKRPTVTL